jgi:alpha-tubulin suppressor-like RCC1 family protein
VANVRVVPGADTIVQGDTVRFVATPMDVQGNALTGRTISWSISDSGIATVAGGLVTGRAVGQALVIATAEGQAGSSFVRVMPQQPNAPVIFASVSAGGLHTCGLSQDSVAYCWGNNGWGQLGDGIFGTTRTIPTPVTGGYRFASLAPGDYFTCGITAGGIALCWGGNMHGELGFDPSDAPCFDACPRPTPVSGNIPFASLTGGWEHTCGLTAASEAYCWGLSYWNEASREATGSFTPVAVPGGLRFALVTAGFYYTCGLTPSGVAYCWGLNDQGQLGDGSTTDRRNPAAVSGGLTFATLSPHPVAYHTCGVTPAGSAYCWGTNGGGQLGDGSTVASSQPVAVGGGLTFATLAAGWAHTCGLTTAGAAYCWGSNAQGQLGVGSTTPSVTPVAVGGGLTFVTLSAGWAHTCGLASDGIVHCWGLNGSGQLGNGATTNSLVPVPVSPPATASWAGTAGGGSAPGEVRLRRPSRVGGHARDRRGS